MNNTNNYITKLTLPTLIIFHLIGLVGMIFFDLRQFASLSMYNLLLSLVLLYVAQISSKLNFVKLFIPVFAVGYAVEVLGVHTGFPFGNYHYGSSLGIKLFEVPLIIGVNWFMLVMGAGFLTQLFLKNRGVQILVSALIMVLVDFPIEQMASKLDYWHWEGDVIPVQNFAGWFVISVFMQWLFQLYMKGQKNILAVPYIIVVSIFFLMLNISL